ncbi:MAG: sulfatase-like hydrolase/transferase [Phycisphaerae bacterium]|nr:sulfatase-like hydrolase/transferase [Phycisphaerae bacterium]
MLNRRSFLRRSGAAVLAVGMSGCMAAQVGGGKRRPNVIIILTDDQGYGDLGCHGNKIIKTPNMDKLHSESTRLTNFHVGPTCAPTRAGLVTGRNCNRTGVWHTIMGRSLLRKDEVTIGNVFSDNGYATAMFGKWHMGDNYPFRPEDRGFDEVLRHGGGGVTQTPDAWGNDYFDDNYWHNGEIKQYKGYCTDIWFDGAKKFIDKNKNKPFFCYLATNAPHGPFNIADEYSKQYDKETSPNPYFYGMITNIDDNIKKLDTLLEKRGLKDNTILIFMTDNGTAAGISGNGKLGFNANMRGKKGSEYDGGHRVPCFIRWPDGEVKAGKDIDRITAHLDILPTLIDMCNMNGPKNVKFDGNSIKPLIMEENPKWPDRVIITDSQRILHPEKWRKSAVMTDRWRLVNGKELYDMKVDVSQANDVATANPAVVKRLRDEYEKWWTSISSRFDEYCPVIVGTKHENPSRLTSHDWLAPDALRVWPQQQIRVAVVGNGFWAIDVAVSGKYRIELCRWPKEADLAINASAPATEIVPPNYRFMKGSVINPIKARLKVADIDITRPIDANKKAIVFDVELKTGETTLQSWFIDKDDKKRGAYFVYVTKL